jgi:ABC-type glutathione transport system ATPase component
MQVTDLRCTIDGRALLDDVSLTVEIGEPLALLGPSGGGKSLLLACLLGLAPAAAQVRGRLLWKGTAIDLGDRRAMAKLRGRGITLVPQAAAVSLDPVRKIGAQLVEVTALHGEPADVAGRLAEVGLPLEFARRHPLSLSGGQAQRVALALALACRPAVLLADEPTASLDCVAAVELLTLLCERCAARGIALVLVSHDLALIAGRCRRAVVLADGRVVASGSLAELLASPPEPTTQALVAAARRGVVEA